MSLPSPEEQISRLTRGYWVSQAIHVAARLRVADLLRDGPRPVEELADRCQAHAPSLYRLLRTLSGEGIFVETRPGHFALTPLAECLRSDTHPGLHAMILMRGEWQYRAWGELLHSVQTGQSAFAKVHGMPLFDHLRHDPGRAALFDLAMSGVHDRETEAMLAAYDFGGTGVLADVGGGSGRVLKAALERYPRMQGILYDLPDVVERARPLLTAAGLAGRCRLVAGSFFEHVPAGADTYLLRHILHDWEDDQALAILRRCREAIPGSGKLLIGEMILSEGNEPSFAKWLDLAMLVVPGGRERTEGEYARLLGASGFRPTRTVRTSTELCVIEAAPG